MAERSCLVAAIAAVSEDAAPGAVLDSVRAAVDADGALPRRYGLRFHEHRMRSPGLISFLVNFVFFTTRSTHTQPRLAYHGLLARVWRQAWEKVYSRSLTHTHTLTHLAYISR